MQWMFQTRMVRLLPKYTRELVRPVYSGNHAIKEENSTPPQE
jgi:hypothetical protein